MKIQVKRRTQLHQLAAIFRLSSGLLAFLASASSRKAADQPLTRASEKCSKPMWKYACDRVLIVSPDLANQFKHFE